MSHKLCILIIVILLLVLWRARDANQSADQRAHFRRLWVDHGMYTRFYIVSYLTGGPDTDFVAKRLMRNQDDIGAMIGGAAGQHLTQLLKDHISGAVAILTDLKGGSPALGRDVAAWYRNGESIARYLMQINPALPHAEASRMMKVHLDLTAQEAKQFLSGDYAGSIATYDRVMGELMQMSDFILSGHSS